MYGKIIYVLPRIREYVLVYEDNRVECIEPEFNVLVDRWGDIQKRLVKDLEVGDVVIPPQV